MIDGVQIKEFQDIVNAQGAVQHMVRETDELFERFGEVYFSITNPGVVKAWHRQLEQTNLLSCIAGTLLLVLYDDREGSPTKGNMLEIRFGNGMRKVVKVPPRVVYGWKNIGSQQAILANCASHVHDPAKSQKLGLEEIQYNW